MHNCISYNTKAMDLMSILGPSIVLILFHMLTLSLFRKRQFQMMFIYLSSL